MTELEFESEPLLLSTAYFPTVEYIALLVKHKGALIELYETYPKQTWRNRCRIMTANCTQDLTVPVKKPLGNKTITSEVSIYNQENWHLNHIRAIHSAYSGSPYYLYYMDEFQPFFTNENENLVVLNNSILLVILKLLRFNFTIQFTKDFVKPGDFKHDFRYNISPKLSYDKSVFEKYIQVFSDRYDFEPNLSILDLIFNLGPEARSYIERLSKLL